MAEPLRVGRYEIIRPLARSMTNVYLAIDTVENRKAALKLIKPDGERTTQLVMEAERRGAAIQRELWALDPRMVEVYEYGDADGYFFVAMQFVEGRNLAEVLDGERVIEPNRAAVIALEICEQLAKFHTWQSAVVHGDIKPSNIHLGPNDTVRLLDFGIAKTLRAHGEATVHNFGSPGYCAPERLTRSQVDQQSDLWAVGATLYEMLAGAPPYRAEDTRRLESLIRSKRPPRALPARCPRGLRAIVGKALAPEPERRYSSAETLRADLQAFLERRPTAAEIERRGFGPNATMEAAREYIRRATQTLVRVKRTLQVAGAAAWFLMGMALWIGGTLAVQKWIAHRVQKASSPPVATRAIPAILPSAPRPNPAAELPGLYVTEAEKILAAYRASADPVLDDFDWHKAEIYLERAVKLGGNDAHTLGELALSKGYATLERLADDRYSAAGAAQLRATARAQFTDAAAKLPDNPDPHLGLARLYVYAQRDVAKAMSEFREAERLGAELGRREIEQQADVYRLRAESEAARQPRLARADAQKALALYARVPGFDQVDARARQLRRLSYGTRRRSWR